MIRSETYPITQTQSTSLQKVPYKKVRFNYIVKVMLIPTIEEYENAGLKPYLWGSKEEWENNRNAALLHYGMKEKLKITAAPLDEGSEGDCPNLLEIFEKSFLKIKRQAEKCFFSFQTA